MSDALSRHADEAFNELPDERSRLLAEILFKALTERGPDNRELRRPTSLSAICEIAGASMPEVAAVIEVFRGGGRSFLMPPAGVALQPETVIDISHESLIRNWVRLMGWVKDEAESARIYRRLAGAATDYRAGVGGLLDDVTLQYVLRWREKSKPDRAWGVRYHPEFDNAMAYLEESTVARDSRIAAEQERERRELETARAFAEKQARSARRMRRLTAALCVLLLFALGTVAYAFHAKVESKRNEKDARDAQVAAQKSERAALNAKEDALISERDAKHLTERLEAEKAQTVALAADLDKKKKEAERALAAESKALDAKVLETKRANEQADAAQEATTAASSIARTAVPLVSQAYLLRKGNEAYRRGELVEALDHFGKLREQLEVLVAGSGTGPAKPNLNIEDLQMYADSLRQIPQLSIQLGWTLSNIGSTHLRRSDFPKAIGAYEEALKVFKPLPESSNDPIVFDTYMGLAQAYHALAVNGRSTVPDKSQAQADFRKAEEHFQSALAFQQGALVEGSWVVADTHLQLARLYVDSGKLDQAEVSFKRAVEGRRRGPNGNVLDNNERADLVATLRELGEFYQGQETHYDDAIRIFNEMITEQGAIGFSSQAQEMANSYSDLGQLYAAKNDKVKAGNASSAANLLQRTALKFRQIEKNPGNSAQPAFLRDLSNDLDDLGDVYVKLGKVTDAEDLYLKAWGFRQQGNVEPWKSLDKLAKFYRDTLTNYPLSEKYNQLLIEYYSNKPQSTQYAGALIQLAALDVQAGRPADAESHYRSALKIFKEHRDWRNQEIILFRLSKLFESQKQVAEQQQALQDRVITLTEFFNQLVTAPGPQRNDAVLLVSEYLYALNALATFYGGNDTSGAEATYERAFAANAYITGKIYNAKILSFYADTLKDYNVLLKKLNKQARADQVAEKEKIVRTTLLQLDQIRQQQDVAQQAPQGAATAAP